MALRRPLTGGGSIGSPHSNHFLDNGTESPPSEITSQHPSISQDPKPDLTPIPVVANPAKILVSNLDLSSGVALRTMDPVRPKSTILPNRRTYPRDCRADRTPCRLPMGSSRSVFFEITMELPALGVR